MNETKFNQIEPALGGVTQDFNYTDIETISIDQVYDYVANSRNSKWCIVRIEPFWDQRKLLEDMRQNSYKVPYMKKDPETYSESYEGISIQKTGHEKTAHEENYNSVMRNSLPGEPIYLDDRIVYFTKDGFSSTPPPNINLIERSPVLDDLFNVLKDKPKISAPQYLNEWAGVWADFLLKFAEKGLMNVRGRYLRSMPGQYARRHYDGECRLHVPLWTNDKVFTTFFDEKDNYKQLGKYNMPADGSAYLFNAYVPHNFGNFGDDTRTHAVFGITHEYHVSWKHYQPDLKTYRDVLIDYAKELVKIKTK